MHHGPSAAASRTPSESARTREAGAKNLRSTARKEPAAVPNKVAGRSRHRVGRGGYPRVDAISAIDAARTRRPKGELPMIEKLPQSTDQVLGFKLSGKLHDED